MAEQRTFKRPNFGSADPGRDSSRPGGSNSRRTGQTPPPSNAGQQPLGPPQQFRPFPAQPQPVQQSAAAPLNVPTAPPQPVNRGQVAAPPPIQQQANIATGAAGDGGAEQAADSHVESGAGMQSVDRRAAKAASRESKRSAAAERKEQAKIDRAARKQGLHAVVADGETLHVPMAGKALHRNGRAARQRTRALGYVFGVAAVTAGTAFAALGVTALINRPTAMPISADDVSKYRLDEYNVSAAAAYADNYLRVCLERSADGKYPESRRAMLNAMASVADPACDPVGGGSVGGSIEAARNITSVVWVGDATTVEGIPNARFMTFDVLDGSGDRRYTLPIYLADLRTGQGPRIVGELGLVPDAWPANPTAPKAGPRTLDGSLANSMRESFLPDFLAAWADSGSTLPQYLTGSAGQAAKAGLNGKATNTSVGEVTAYLPAGMREGQYPDRAKVQLDVTMMATVDGHATKLSYRVTIQIIEGKWFVDDIAGGQAVIPSGDNSTTAPSQAPRTTPTPSAPSSDSLSPSNQTSATP